MTTTTSYDARSGQLTVSTDPAGVTVSNSFDAFCRPTESDKIPVGGGSAVWMKKIGYPAVLSAIVSGLATNYMDVVVNDGVGGVEGRTYVDGFGRPVQTRIQGENGNYPGGFNRLRRSRRSLPDDLASFWKFSQFQQTDHGPDGHMDWIRCRRPRGDQPSGKRHFRFQRRFQQRSDIFGRPGLLLLWRLPLGAT